jgi:ankyrin repeat protein
MLILCFILGLASAWAGEIHDACKQGDLAKVQQLLAADTTLLQAKTPEGKSPLHMATGWGQTDIVNFLLDAGADIHATNNNGGTPIHVAASQNQPACAAILVSRGANLEDVRQLGGMTPLAIAVLKGNLEVAEQLLKLGANPMAKLQGRATILQVAGRRASPAMQSLLQRYALPVPQKR